MQLNSLTEEELKEVAIKYNEKAFRGTQLFNLFHSQQKTDLNGSNLPKKFIEELEDKEEIANVKILEEYASKLDETKKLLFEFDDENIVEGVLMKYKHGYSQCVSTQVGCRMGCVFCASTKGGLIRNLTPYEMLGQVYEVEKKYNIKVSNIILMGSGEPLDNYENVIKFLKLLHNEKGHNTSFRNMTISTCGVADKIYDLADENFPITLAISLHNTNNISRDKIMPINKKYKIEDTIKACKYYSEKTGSRITFEYTLIHGQNDSEENALELRELLRGLKSHINLIPLNPIEEYDEKRPDRGQVESFKKKLEKLSLTATIRRELGSDINASCGQLRRKYKRGGTSEVCSSN